MRDPHFERAMELALRARREAAAREYEAGERRNPFKAKAGREAEFEEARLDVRGYDVLLELLTKEMQRRKREESRARKVAEEVIDFLTIFGMETLAALGFAAAFLLLAAPEPIVKALAALGVGVALARALHRLGK